MFFNILDVLGVVPTAIAATVRAFGDQFIKDPKSPKSPEDGPRGVLIEWCVRSSRSFPEGDGVPVCSGLLMCDCPSQRYQNEGIPTSTQRAEDRRVRNDKTGSLRCLPENTGSIGSTKTAFSLPCHSEKFVVEIFGDAILVRTSALEELQV